MPQIRSIPAAVRSMFPTAVLLFSIAASTGVARANRSPFLDLTLGTPGDSFGFSISPAGDVNGDGYPDFIVGAPGFSSGGAYVYLGRPAEELPGSEGRILLKPPDGGYVSPAFGWAVAAAGDVNGDGFGDVLVGDCTVSPWGGGRACLYFGGSSMDGDPDVVLRGDWAPDDRFGWSVSSAGDLNGDGFADVIVGAPTWYNRAAYGEPYSAGRAYVFLGGTAPDGTADIVLEPPAILLDLLWYAHFGLSVNQAGDVNGDGSPDILVAQGRGTSDDPAFGATLVYYGGPAWTGQPALVLRSQPVGYTALPRRITCAAGDLNGDGYDDVAVRMPAWRADGGLTSASDSVYVYFGGPTGGHRTVPDVALSGGASGFGFESSVWGGADVNGDGYPDVIVGTATWASPEGYPMGRVYVFFGGPGMDGVYDEAIDGPVGGQRFGSDVSASDLNGDSIADVAVGAPAWPPAYGTVPGHVYAFDLSTPLAARAFVRDGHRTIPLVDAPSRTCIQLEPVEGSFRCEDVDYASVRLASSGTGETDAISPAPAKSVVIGDTDANGIPETQVCFALTDLRRLFGDLRGRHEIEASVEGCTLQGRRLRAPVSLTVLGLPPSAETAASIVPNPLNPTGKLRFSVSSAGPLAVALYDVNGRCVRTLLRERWIPAGAHHLILDGRNDRGGALASGVYFYRIEDVSGVRTGRLVIAR